MFKKYLVSNLKLILIFLILMTLARVSLLKVYRDFPQVQEISSQLKRAVSTQLEFQILYTGLRFDLLVLGFLWIPVWLLFWMSFIVKKINLFFKIQSIYFYLMWGLLSLIYWNDGVFFVQKLDHFYGLERIRSGALWADLYQNLSSQDISYFIFYLIIFILFSVMGWSGVYRFKKSIQSVLFEEFYKYSIPKVFIFFIISFLLVGLAARGTLAPHHLGRAHAEISNQSSINELVINAPWAFWN